MRVLFRFLLPFYPRVLLAILLGAAVVASNMGLLAAAAYLIAAASLTHLLALLIVPMYLVRFLSVSRAAARYLERLISHGVTFRILARLRLWLFDRLWMLGPMGAERLHSGDTLSRVMGDVDELQNAYLLLVSPVAVAVAVSALLSGLMLVYSSTLAVVTLAYLVAAGAGIPIVVGLLARGVGRRQLEASALLNVHLVDSIQGSRDILTNGASALYLDRLRTVQEQVGRSQQRVALLGGVREGGADLLTSLTMVTALALTIPLVTSHALSALYVAVPALLVLAGFEAVRPMGEMAGVLGHVQTAAHRVVSIGEDIEPPAEPAAPVPLPAGHGLAFDGVTLAYTSERKPALWDVRFAVPEGGRVAIVGPSGAGKTSIIRLLTRAWDPTAGQVSIGGTDIRAYAQEELRAALGVVTQDSYIFNDIDSE